MLVDSIALFGKEFHIFIADEFKYELIMVGGCKKLLWWPLVISDVTIGIR